MPLVQIDLDRSLADKKAAISQGVHQAFIDALGIPANDRWCIFRVHDDSELVFDPTNGGVDRKAMLCIQVTMVHRYSVASKYELYRRIAARLEALGIRHEDVLVCVMENGFEDWYAGKPRGD